MIPKSRFVAYDLGPTEDVNFVELSAIYAKMRQLDPSARRLLPIRSASGAVLYVIHDSTLTAYAEGVGEPSGQLDNTLGDLLGVNEFNDLITAFALVPCKQPSRMHEASWRRSRIAMILFVTPSGKRDEHAIGWLTNTLLAGVQ